MLAIVYHSTKYRIHAAGCRDVPRERGYIDGLREVPDGTTLAEIAAIEFADFIAEDPDYYTPETVLWTFEQDTTILPCAAGLLGAAAVVPDSETADQLQAWAASHEASLDHDAMTAVDYAAAGDLDCPKITPAERHVLWTLVLVDAALLAGVSDDVLAGMVSASLVGYVEADGMTPHFVATPVGVRALREHDYRVALRRDEAMAAAIECGFAVRVANA